MPPDANDAPLRDRVHGRPTTCPACRHPFRLTDPVWVGSPVVCENCYRTLRLGLPRKKGGGAMRIVATVTCLVGLTLVAGGAIQTVWSRANVAGANPNDNPSIEQGTPEILVADSRETTQPKTSEDVTTDSQAPGESEPTRSDMPLASEKPTTGTPEQKPLDVSRTDSTSIEEVDGTQGPAVSHYQWTKESARRYLVEFECGHDDQVFRRTGQMLVRVEPRDGANSEFFETNRVCGLLVSDQGHFLFPTPVSPSHAFVIAPGIETPRRATVVAFNERLELALVKVDGKFEKPFRARIAAADMGPIRRLAITGFASGRFVAALIPCEMAPAEEYDANRFPTLVFPSVPPIPGLPVVNVDGHWVGLASQRLSPRTAAVCDYCIPARDIVEWLQGKGVPFALDDREILTDDELLNQVTSCFALIEKTSHSIVTRSGDVARVSTFTHWDVENAEPGKTIASRKTADPGKNDVSGKPPRSVAKALVDIERSSGVTHDQFGSGNFELSATSSAIEPLSTWAIEPLGDPGARQWSSVQPFALRALPETHSPDEPLYLLLGEQAVARVVMSPEPREEWRIPARIASVSRITKETDDKFDIHRVFRVETLGEPGIVTLATGEAKSVFNKKLGLLDANDIRYELRLQGPEGPPTIVQVKLRRVPSAPPPQE